MGENKTLRLISENSAVQVKRYLLLYSLHKYSAIIPVREEPRQDKRYIGANKIQKTELMNSTKRMSLNPRV